MNLKSLKEKLLTREIMVYLIVGIIVTLSNWLLYSLLMTIWDDENWRIANVISILTSILVAYILNKKFVFLSKESIFPEIIHFFVSRLLISAVFEHGIMELFIGVLNFNPVVDVFNYKFQLIKIVGSVFVVIGNYIISKFLVFNKKKILN